MEPLTYTIELQPLENGGFSVTVPALPGCVTWGETFDHAVSMAREASELWIENLVAHGKPIPEEQSARPVTLGVQVHRPIMI